MANSQARLQRSHRRKLGPSIARSSSMSSSAPSSLPSWPPSFTEDQLQHLTTLATSYALSHGLLYLPPSHSDTALPVNRDTSTPSSAIHAPITLVPTPFPRVLFEKAKRLQRIYNVLYARIAMDVEFLDRVMGMEVGVGRVDEFTGQLWAGWKAIREEGIVQVSLIIRNFIDVFELGREAECCQEAVTPGCISI